MSNSPKRERSSIPTLTRNKLKRIRIQEEFQSNYLKEIDQIIRQTDFLVANRKEKENIRRRQSVPETTKNKAKTVNNETEITEKERENLIYRKVRPKFTKHNVSNIPVKKTRLGELSVIPKEEKKTAEKNLSRPKSRIPTPTTVSRKIERKKTSDIPKRDKPVQKDQKQTNKPQKTKTKNVKIAQKEQLRFQPSKSISLNKKKSKSQNVREEDKIIPLPDEELQLQLNDVISMSTDSVIEESTPKNRTRSNSEVSPPKSPASILLEEDLIATEEILKETQKNLNEEIIIPEIAFNQSKVRETEEEDCLSSMDIMPLKREITTSEDEDLKINIVPIQNEGSDYDAKINDMINQTLELADISDDPPFNSTSSNTNIKQDEDDDYSDYDDIDDEKESSIFKTDENSYSSEDGDITPEIETQYQRKNKQISESNDEIKSNPVKEEEDYLEEDEESESDVITTCRVINIGINEEEDDDDEIGIPNLDDDDDAFIKSLLEDTKDDDNFNAGKNKDDILPIYKELSYSDSYDEEPVKTQPKVKVAVLESDDSEEDLNGFVPVQTITNNHAISTYGAHVLSN